jgi:Uma2 family endonuclease
MATSTPVIVPLAEYLETVYRPDRDWIDGETKERNLGEKPHARIQGFLIRFLGNHEAEWKILVYPEQRVQVSGRRFRVADICVTRADDPDPAIVRTPPLLCIEVLSKDDTLNEILDRVRDYAAMGVAQVWVVDPLGRHAYMANDRGFEQPASGNLTVTGTPISVSIAAIFDDLDKAIRRT